MEEIKETIQGILPTLSPQLLEEVCEHLTSIGVETGSDLHYVQASDLTPMLKGIQARKLIDKWSQGTVGYRACHVF